MPNRSYKSMKKAITKIYNILPKGSMVTSTSDSGKEFACYAEIKNALDIYFADYHSHCKKGVMKTLTVY